MRKRAAIVPADAQIGPLGTQQSRAMIICPRDGNRKLTIRDGVIGFAALVVVSAVDIATACAQHWYGKGTWCIQPRSEEHTSELQSPDHLVCRLLLEKKKQK